MKNFNFLNFNTFDIFSQFKLYYILIMILIFIYLIFMEILNKYSPHKNKYLDSGFSINKTILRIMGIIEGASFANFIINKKDIIELSDNLNKETNKLKEEIFELEKSQSETKTSVVAKISSLKEEMTEMKKQVDKVKEKLNKKNDTDIITKEDLNSNSDLQYYLSQADINWKKTVNYLKEFENEMNKKNFLPENFNFSDLYKNLTNDQLGGIGLLMFSQVLIGSAISIIFVFFGEYLIQRYNLENKYPKLAKFIQLRRKFQRYYLLLNIFYIISVGIILAIFGIWFFLI